MTTTPTKITITPPSQELFTFPLQDSFEVKCADWKRKKHLALVWVTDTAIVITNRRLKEQRTFFFNKVESFSTDIGLEVFHFRYRPSVKTSGKDIYLFTRQCVAIQNAVNKSLTKLLAAESRSTSEVLSLLDKHNLTRVNHTRARLASKSRIIKHLRKRHAADSYATAGNDASVIDLDLSNSQSLQSLSEVA
eukprot:TRINITY_DN60_c0_g1_i1.p1 TRINITY_DN60_c0_g1~~TRINITY_DN60_c0_g1_i1.p1  ORF type:complete len:204 (-),score=48.63 TRINITY_DN60_c0_g1_i1:215-790(-)